LGDLFSILIQYQQAVFHHRMIGFRLSCICSEPLLDMDKSVTFFCLTPLEPFFWLYNEFPLNFQQNIQQPNSEAITTDWYVLHFNLRFR
jgi:hypothetical protein